MLLLLVCHSAIDAGPRLALSDVTPNRGQDAARNSCLVRPAEPCTDACSPGDQLRIVAAKPAATHALYVSSDWMPRIAKGVVGGYSTRIERVEDRPADPGPATTPCG